MSLLNLYDHTSPAMQFSHRQMIPQVTPVSFYKGTFIPVRPLPNERVTRGFARQQAKRAFTPELNVSLKSVAEPKPDKLHVTVTNGDKTVTDVSSKSSTTGVGDIESLVQEKTKMELAARVLQLERQLKWHQTLTSLKDANEQPPSAKKPKITLAQKFDKFRTSLVTQVKMLQTKNSDLSEELKSALEDIKQLKIRVADLEKKLSDSSHAGSSRSASRSTSECSTAPSTGTPPGQESKKLIVDDLLPEEESVE